MQFNPLFAFNGNNATNIPDSVHFSPPTSPSKKKPIFVKKIRTWETCIDQTYQDKIHKYYVSNSTAAVSNCDHRVASRSKSSRPPADHDSGVAESNAHGYLFSWWLTYQKGLTYSPSNGFLLPDGATCSADGAWASDEKIAQLTPQQRKKFAPLVPDFVIEVRSTSDQIGKLKKKMTDTWLANGVRLAWLIDPKMKCAYVYRPDQPIEEWKGFTQTLSGEEVCPGLMLDLRKFL